MSEESSVAFTESPSGGHPHDLLARLYREIGISAVAAALEVAYSPQEDADAPSIDYAWAPLGEDIAA
jgi:hypothetical protein